MLYVLCGPSYCGKSTYAEKLKNYIALCGLNTTIINPDSIREELLGDANDQSSGDLIFKTAYERTEKALGNSEFVIFDATNLTSRARKPLLEIAKKHSGKAVAIVFKELSMDEFVERYSMRGRRVPVKVVDKQKQKFVLPTCEEGFYRIHEAKDSDFEVL